MARKTLADELIHCSICGEDYSSTYRRCPFCGERPTPPPPPTSDDEDFDDGYVFDGQALFDDDSHADSKPAASKGGKRLATGNGRGRYDPPSPINWGRAITFGLSILILIVVLIIVFTVVYPMLHTDPNNPVDPDVSTSETQPDVSPDPQPSDPSGEVTDNALTSIILSNTDFTLTQPGNFHTITVVLDPGDWDGELVWTSSDENYATVDQTGKVTNVNQTTSLRRVTITVSGGGVEASCTVYCRGVDADPDATDVVIPGPEPTDGPTEEIAAGTKCSISADGGLNVRSGPGTTYDRIASLSSGDEVTVLEYAGDGWYKIKFGSKEGYVMGDYLVPNT